MGPGVGKQRAQYSDEDMRTAALTAVSFLQAAEIWLETRKPYISPKTAHEYRLNIKTLSAFFGEMRLTEISPDMIRAYQRARQTQCGPFSINHECSVLQQMLKRIGRWPEIAPDYQPLPLPKEKRGRAMTDIERDRLFRIAKTNDNWNACRLFALISVNTSAGPKETSTLRLMDVDLEGRTITVTPEGAKNKHRIRAIPLNDEAFEAIKEAIERAKSLGASDPDHYVFPFRIHRNNYDPTRHQTTFKTAWQGMTAAADLFRFRMYDLRHHAITVLLENPKVSEETAEAVAGHISHEMKRRYSHVRMDSRREAVEALNPTRKKPTKSVTESSQSEIQQQLLTALTNLLKTGEK